ncbi:MAG: tetratricopeptide repeat protein [Deltaproteobacteria bacterium]|nr:tetratricopeptide repeat protein [Deltaproteobacteria bacterium]
MRARSSRSGPLAIALLVLVGITVYANSFGVPFVLDDKTTIIQNPIVKSLANFYANRSGYEYLPNRWVAVLSFALNYRLGGLAVIGYHAVNLAIHLASGLLVYALLRLTFRTPYFRSSRPASVSPSFIPLFAALLFLVHPIQTQAVTYVVQRMTSLATLFYLLSMALYVRARLQMEERPPFPGASFQRAPFFFPLALLAGSTLSAVLAMKTKEISFTLPLAAVLYEVSFFSGPWKKRLLCLLPLLATLPVIPATMLGTGESAGTLLSDVSEAAKVQTAMPRYAYLFTQFRVIVTYLRLLVLPVNQNLDYDYPVHLTFFTPPVFLSFLLLAGLLALAVYLFWRSRPQPPPAPPALPAQPALPALPAPPALSCFRLISFGIVWFFLTLSVESSVIPIVDVIFEHRAYLPSVGAMTAFAAVLFWASQRFAGVHAGRLAVFVAGCVTLALAVATVQRNHVWRNDIRLWEDVVAKSPNKGRANNNLGVALEDAGRRAEAIRAFSRAIAEDPGYSRSYYNLADLYLVSGDPDAALPLLETAIRLSPNLTEAYIDMGAALVRGKRFEQAAAFLEQNLERLRGNPEAHFYLGAALAFSGNKEAARRQLEIVSRLDPGLAGSLASLLR